MKDYIIQQMRESSTWRGLIDVGVGVGLFLLTGHLPLTLPPEVSTALLTIAGGFVARGTVGVLGKDSTTAGTAVKIVQAQAAIDQGKVVVPPTLKE